MATKLKPKSKFFTDAQALLKKGLPVADLQDLAYEYEGITQEHIQSFISSTSKSNAIKAQLEIDRKEAQQIYNRIDEMFTERYPNLVAMEQEENISYYNYENGVYKLLNLENLKNLIHDFFKEKNLLEYRTENKIRDTIGRISSLLKYENKKRFSPMTSKNTKWYLNVKNGLLDPTTRELHPHTPDYFSITQTSFDYNPEAKCPKFEEAVRYSSQDAEGTDIMLKEMFGYMIATEGNPSHKVFYLYGRRARNGKSMVVNVLIGLLGDPNVSKLTLEQLASNSDSIIVPLIGKHINFSDEVNGSKFLDSGRLTSMSSQGNITVSPKHKAPFNYKVRAKFIVACNYFPNFQSGQGMKHRTIVIPFNFHIPKDKRIFDYENILLEEEGSGILNWALEGAEQLKANDYQFYLSSLSLEDTEENNKGNDSVLSFLDDEYIFDEKLDYFYSTEDMYESYVMYCKKFGYTGIKHKYNFSSTLKTYSEETGKINMARFGNKRGYKGLESKEADYKNITNF